MEERANRILIANLPMPVADKEYNWALPKNCRWFTLQTRNGAAIRVAVETGHVASSEPPYFTIKPDNSWDERYLEVDIRYGLPLFLACSSAGEVMEAIMGVYDPSVGGEA